MSPSKCDAVHTLPSFPRPRGDEPLLARAVSAVLGVFPARAGMSRLSAGSWVVNSGFPRPRGDEPNLIQGFINGIKFSPPARG